MIGIGYQSLLRSNNIIEDRGFTVASFGFRFLCAVIMTYSKHGTPLFASPAIKINFVVY